MASQRRFTNGPTFGAPRRRQSRRRRCGGAHVSRLACGLAIAGLAQLAEGVSVADALWSTGVSFGSRYDDHRAPFAPPQDLAVSTVAPQFGFDGASEGSFLRCFARRQYEWYPNHPQATQSLATAPTSDHGTLRAARMWSGVGSLSLDGRYDRSHDLMELGDWALLAGNPGAAHWMASARGGLGRLEGDIRTEGSSYDASGLESAQSLGWSATALPVVGRSTAWLVGWRQRQLALASSWVMRSHLAVTGLRQRLLPALSGQVEAGGYDVDFGDGPRQRGPAFAVALQAARDNDGGISTELRLQRDFMTSVTGSMSRAVGDGRVTIGGESVLDVEGGVYRGPNFTRRLAIGVQDTMLSRSTVLGLEMSYARTRPLHIGEGEVDIFRASGWAVRRLRPWLTGRGGYSYLRQPGFGHRDASDFRRVRLEAAMTVVM